MVANIVAVMRFQCCQTGRYTVTLSLLYKPRFWIVSPTLVLYRFTLNLSNFLYQI